VGGSGFLLVSILCCRNGSEGVEEGLEMTNQDLTLRRTELLNLQEKHRFDMENINAELTRLKKNQSLVINSLWEKVGNVLQT
jgi:hypothetical protein